jgi:hypothetical protein
MRRSPTLGCRPQTCPGRCEPIAGTKVRPLLPQTPAAPPARAVTSRRSDTARSSLKGDQTKAPSKVQSPDENRSFSYDTQSFCSQNSAEALVPLVSRPLPREGFTLASASLFGQSPRPVTLPREAVRRLQSQEPGLGPVARSHWPSARPGSSHLPPPPPRRCRATSEGLARLLHQRHPPPSFLLTQRHALLRFLSLIPASTSLESGHFTRS